MTIQQKFISILFAFLILSIISYSQEIQLKEGQKFLINHLTNKYIVDNDKIIDVNKKDEYQNQFLGNINQVDINNPLRLLLFFGESNTIIYLNQELSQIGEAINLDEIGNIEVKAICSSVTNGFWIFNSFTKRLEYYNEKLKPVHSSEVLNEINSIENNKFELQMYGDRLYLNTYFQGILVFDIYGTYIKTLPIIKANSFQIIGSGILYTLKNQILKYHFESLDNSIIIETNSAINYARFFDEKIYYVDNQLIKEIPIKKLHLRKDTTLRG